MRDGYQRKVQAQGGRDKSKVVVALMRKLTRARGISPEGRPLMPASSGQWSEKVTHQNATAGEASPPSHDLFICNVLNAIPKDDMASMEHPVFSLSTKPDMRCLRYEHNGNTLEIIPSGLGLATVHDKDILIFVMYINSKVFRH